MSNINYYIPGMHDICVKYYKILIFFVTRVLIYHQRYMYTHGDSGNIADTYHNIEAIIYML